MKKKFDSLKFISKLINFSPRQLEGEKKTCAFILSMLRENKIKTVVQNFKVEIPFIEKVKLKADNKNIKCEGCSFESGKINSKEVIISSLLSSSICQDIPNLNFNPKNSGISLKNYYFAPSICFSYKDAPKVILAKKIIGEVQVRKVKHQSANIFVGNIKNPKVISFAHYDSIKKGAIDNASGVAIFMRTILEKPELLKNNLFVFSGSEELSYDKPIYWGSGFRAFEKKYLKIIFESKKIIIVDCVGNAPANLIKNPEITKLAFPILNLDKIGNRIEVLTGDLDELMSVYHSDLDDGRGIKEKYLEEAYNIFIDENKF